MEFWYEGYVCVILLKLLTDCRNSGLCIGIFSFLLFIQIRVVILIDATKMILDANMRPTKMILILMPVTTNTNN